MITKEVEDVRIKHGDVIDENVFIGLTLAILAHKNVVISSEDIHTATYVTGYILNTVWGLQATVLKAHAGITRDDLLKFFFDGTIGGHMGFVYVIEGIDKLPNQLQRLILEMMKSRKIVYNNTPLLANELRTIVGITGEPHTLYPLLSQEFWFQQRCDLKMDINDGRFPTSATLNRSKVTHFITLRNKYLNVTISPEMKRYIYDIIIHVRCHRCVKNGFPTRAIKDLELLCQCLCLIFDRNYVIPTIVKLACRKLIPFKIQMVDPSLEPTLQYGSDIDLVAEMMKRMTPKMVVEDVLRKVGPPL